MQDALKIHMVTQGTQNSHADLPNKREISGFQVPSFKTYYNSNEDRIPSGRNRMCRIRIQEKEGMGQRQAGPLSLPFSLYSIWPGGKMEILMGRGKCRLGFYCGPAYEHRRVDTG